MKYIAGVLAVFAGIALGWLYGIYIGDQKAEQEWLSFLFTDSFRAYYAPKGALLGGFWGAIVGICIVVFGGNSKSDG